MPRQLTGFKPTGPLQLGNYFGAIAPLARRRRDADTTAMIVDLHALTVEHDPAGLRRRTLEIAALLLAAGVGEDTDRLLVQSHVPEHTELHYLLESAASYGEAHRMIQFKQKAGSARERTRLSLLTYPVLMAADILLHDTDEVPVGADQSQHVELARRMAYRFNRRYGDTFTIPAPVNPPVAARIMDLADPNRKMDKTNQSEAGVLYLLDPPGVLRRKINRATTDSDGEVRYDPERKPGVSNLLEILAACVDGDPRRLASQFDSYAPLKQAVGDAVVDRLAPLQRRHAELAARPEKVLAALRAGASHARQRAADTVARARSAVGLLIDDAPPTG
ncbi:MAG: tryptophan--tRNA ligase [Micromonosporaceae bacterium]|nr:tryptophan--tRNA ligase [Micromonosporaceae bacterium]